MMFVPCPNFVQGISFQCKQPAPERLRLTGKNSKGFSWISESILHYKDFRSQTSPKGQGPFLLKPRGTGPSSPSDSICSTANHATCIPSTIIGAGRKNRNVEILASMYGTETPFHCLGILNEYPCGGDSHLFPAEIREPLHPGHLVAPIWSARPGG